MPRWRYRLVLGRVSIGTCQKLDRYGRRVVCKILHSPATLSKKWIHLSMRMGGLGIPNVTEVTYLGKLRLMFDQLLTLVFGQLLISVFERKLACTRGLDPCARCASLNQFRWEKWRKSTHGRGAEAFTGRVNCRWNHDSLCDRRRCGGVGESLVRERKKSIPSCRAYGEGAETISRILQNCRSSGVSTTRATSSFSKTNQECIRSRNLSSFLIRNRTRSKSQKNRFRTPLVSSRSIDYLVNY